MFKHNNRSFKTYDELKSYIQGEQDGRDNLRDTEGRLFSIATIAVAVLAITLLFITAYAAFKTGVL